MDNVSELVIEYQDLNHTFVDQWIDDLDKLSMSFDFAHIHTLTLNEVTLHNNIAYDIFHDFSALQRLNILHSHFGSRGLNNILTYINPYSVTILDLSESSFDSFDIDDFSRIKGLFSLKQLILPRNINYSNQILLKRFLGVI